MNHFDLESHLTAVYATFPEANRRPMIGITTNYSDGDATLRDRYYKQVVAAGGIPILIPPVADKQVLVNTLDHLDGLLLTGGGDYNPLWAGDEPSPLLHGINAERDLPELMLTRLAFNRQIPMLGICRGMQTLAVALGGKVAQDISDEALAASPLPPLQREGGRPAGGASASTHQTRAGCRPQRAHPHHRHRPRFLSFRDLRRSFLLPCWSRAEQNGRSFPLPHWGEPGRSRR